MDVNDDDKISRRNIVHRWKSRSLSRSLKNTLRPTQNAVSAATNLAQKSIPRPACADLLIPDKEPNPKKEADTTVSELKRSCLWDEAYDRLKEENPALVAEYEDLLIRVESETKTTLSTPHESITETKSKIHHDGAARQQMLQLVALHNLEKSQEGKLKTTFFGQQIVWQDAIGTFGLGVNWVQNYARYALKDVPYAPIAMAAVGLLIPLLTGPLMADSENHQGLLYVVSQIKYYIKMEALMLPECLDAGVSTELREHVRSLYTLVIDFQIQSVLRFDRSPLKNYFGSVVDYDGWGTRLEMIKETEQTLRENMQQAASWTVVQELESLKQEAQHSRKSLGEIAHQTQKIAQHMSDAEFRRCLDTLKATGFELDKESIQDFKGGLLKDSYQWVVQNHDFKRWISATSGQLLWIRGDPGKGKTMLLCGIVDELSRMAKHGTNIAFIFCQANKETRNNASAVLRGLIYMLVRQQPSLISFISDESFSGDNAWFALQRAFINILNSPELRATYLVIDGLDECIEGRQSLLKLLVNHSSAHANVKWVVSSRNWPEIEQDLDQATEMKLHLELNEDVLSNAIRSFIEYKVDNLRSKKRDKPEIWKAVQDYLLENAKGTFLWVALVWKHLTEVPWWKVREKLKEFPPGLDKIYERMIGQITRLEDADLYKSVLRVSTTVLRPITLDEMMIYVEVPEDSVEVLEDVVRGCGSFLSLQGNTVLLVHQSVEDFLLTRASGEILPQGKESAQHHIYAASIRLLKETLRRDIYNLGAPGYPVEQIKPPRSDPLLAVRYACSHWIDHLLLCNDELLKIEFQEGGMVDTFLEQNYLHWLEAMSILKSLPVAIKSVRNLEKFLESILLLQPRQTEGEPIALLIRVRDAVRFVQYTKFGIERSPLQVYYSSLIFSPNQSITKQCYYDRESRAEWILEQPEVEEHWSPCLQTLEGHGEWIISVAWSSDGRRLASTCDTNSRVWELDTGNCSHVLEDWLATDSPACWLDDNRVVLVTNERGVNVWHLDTGHSVVMLEPQKSSPSWIIGSPDGSRLAIVRDNVIDVHFPGATNESFTLQSTMDRIISVSWSPDGDRLAALNAVSSVEIWDLCKGMRTFTLERTSWATCSAWSPDGSLLALGTEQGNIQVWDSETLDLELDIEGHNHPITCLVWSPDGSQLASGSRDNSIAIWDTHTTKRCATFEGHTDSIQSISWSANGRLLASGSIDETIKIWDATARNELVGREYGSSFISIEYDKDAKQLAASMSNNNVSVWNHATGQRTICEGHIGKVNDIAWSPGGNHLASASHDKTIKIWDPATGQCKILEGHTNDVMDVAWSIDETQIASSSIDGTIRVWNPITGDHISLFGDEHIDHHDYDDDGRDYGVWYNGVSWSPTGQHIASADDEHNVRVWDLATRQCKILEGHTDSVNDVAWSQDGRQLASASWDGTVRVWDSTTTQCTLLLHVKTDGFLHFDINSSELHTAEGKFDPGSLKDVWQHSKSSGTPKPSGYGLCVDRSWITYNGSNSIWLPPEYRPNTRHALSISNTALTIGCSSGRLAMLKFSALNPLKEL